MLNSRQKKNILILVLSEKKILNESKNHNPPLLQVKWSVPNSINKGNNKITEHRATFQRERQNS